MARAPSGIEEASPRSKDLSSRTNAAKASSLRGHAPGTVLAPAMRVGRAGTLTTLLTACAALAGCATPTVDGPAPPVGDYLDIPFTESREFEGETYEPTFDLVAELTPVRNQGSRNTCTTFASIGLMEFFYRTEYGWSAPDFSEQYLQWLVKAKSYDPWPDAETSNAWYVMTAIQEHGVPVESHWPFEPTNPSGPPCDADAAPAVPCYTGTPPEGTPELWSMPAGAPRWVHPDDIKGHLVRNRAPVIGDVKWAWQAWSHGDSPLPTNPEYRRLGVVPFPGQADLEALSSGGHTFLIVGWDDTLEIARLDEHGLPTGVVDRGFFILKNSFGTEDFGPDNPHGSGFGLISQRYLSELGRGLILDRTSP